MEYAWRKYNIDLTALDASFAGADALYFRVYIDNLIEEPFLDDHELIYEGRAVAVPGGTGMPVAVNDIVADHFTRDLDIAAVLASEDTFRAFIPDNRLAVFVMLAASLDGQTWVQGDGRIFTMLSDWSWLTVSPLLKFGQGGCLNNLIRPEVAYGSFYLATVCGGWDVVSDLVIYLDGNRGSTLAEVNTWNNGNAVVPLNDDTLAGERSIDLRTPDEGAAVINPCAIVYDCVRFVLYYRNAFGGWDWLLVRGSQTRSEGYDRLTAGRSLPAYSTAGDRQKVNYRNGVAERWHLPLGQFTDAQSEQLWHLFGSPSVYLFDIERKTFTPVTITNNEHTESTFRNNGHRIVEYTIDVESALDKERR